MCETADVPAGFRSNVCKHVGFPVSRHKTGEKVIADTAAGFFF